MGSASSRRAGFETALRAYVANCVETVDSCFLGDSVEEGLERITAFLDDVDASPLPTVHGPGADRRATPSTGSSLPLYAREYWFAAQRGAPVRLRRRRVARCWPSPTPTPRAVRDGYTDNSSEAFPAISCLDDPYSVPPARVPTELPAFESASPTFGDVFAWGMVGCRGQVAESTEEPLTIDGSGAPPILVVGTTRDPATPYEWAEALADQLESGVLVTRDGDGHTGYFQGNECVDRVVEAFWLRDEVPEDGLSC